MPTLSTPPPICHHPTMDDSPTAAVAARSTARLAPDGDDARFIRRLLILLVVGGTVWALLRAGDLLILAFGSILGAIVIHAIADLYATYCKAPAKTALGLGMVTMLALLGFLGWLFVVAFHDQVVLLVTQGPAILAKFAQQMSASPSVPRSSRR